ncbi:MAG: RNA-binding cell elongation regulator Jag/EloR [Candidatus Woodwardiibium sp.]
MKETIVYGKTIALALKRGAEELGVDEAKAEYEVLEEPKKGFFGVGASDAKLRVFYQPSPAEIAADFVRDLLMNMQFEANVSIESADEEGAAIAVSGEGLGLLIGRHGDVLDAVQHLAGLAANHGRSGYYRITVDIENYRAKRAETLRQLARRMAEKTLKYRRNNTLEPMNAYERRIIHTEVQSIEGVTTYSIGSDADRRIVIALDKKSKNRDADGDSAEA